MNNYSKLIPFFLVLLPHSAILAASNYLLDVSIPSDPKAKYKILSIQPQNEYKLLVVTRREGPSGISYAERLVDCLNDTFMYTSESDTIEGLKRRSPSGRMAPLLDGSISYYISKYACNLAKF